MHCIYEGERVKRRRLNGEEAQNHRSPHFPQTDSGFMEPCETADGSAGFPDFLTSNSSQLEYHNAPSEPHNALTEPHRSYLSPASTSSGVTSNEAQELDSHASRTNNNRGSLLDQILDPDAPPMPPNHNPSIWIRTKAGDEYTGPSSGISAISDTGLNWIRRKVKGCGCLCNMFKQIRGSLLNHLRQPKCIDPESWSNFQAEAAQKPLPPWATVEEYVRVYFAEVQVLFPVLNQERFEAQLASVRQGHEQETQTPSWKALLFAVLASGCRAALSDETAGAFQKSGSESWSYFASALSYEQILVHVATDLTAVQALTVMTVFAQGLSSPQRLEYTLCSTAVRLAFSLSLNRAPQAEWDLSEVEKNERNRTFWTLYCLDKTLALRCGRPSLIDDSEISCPFPRDATITIPQVQAPANSGHQSPDFFRCFTRFARICGLISRELYSAFALSQCCVDLVKPAAQLLADLQAWKLTTPTGNASKIRQSLFSKSARDRDAIPKTQLVVLELSYYYAVCAVYRRFGPIYCQEGEDETQVQHLLDGIIPLSQVEAARSMILLTKYMDVESYHPGWLLFYYPMTALITIFIHLLCNASDASANRDIALMEVAVGFFGRLEYVTSGEAGFTQVAEFVRQARFIVSKSPQDPCHCGSEDTLNSPRGCDKEHTVANTTTITNTNISDNQAGNMDCHQQPPPGTRQRPIMSLTNEAIQVTQTQSIDFDTPHMNPEELDFNVSVPVPVSKLLPGRSGSTGLLVEPHSAAGGGGVGGGGSAIRLDSQEPAPAPAPSPYDPWLDAWLNPAEPNLPTLLANAY